MRKQTAFVVTPISFRPHNLTNSPLPRSKPFRNARYRRCIIASTRVQVGEIVAAQLSPTTLVIGRVTGVASSGDTVDLALLDEFVRELYIETDRTTYTKATLVRPVRAEYVPSQQGWIVLEQDLQQVKNYFDARPIPDKVVVEQPPPRELSPEALEKQLFPRPTRTQAFIGAALSLPLSALFYSAFAGARQAYAQNPAGEDLMSGQVFRKIVLLATSGASIGCIVVGCALFLYALGRTEESQSS